MAQVNRYTKTSQSRFNPMTLQELMLVPAYKRQQHDAMSESIGAIETQLAQIDPSDIHSEVAKAEQQRLYDELNKRSELLAREGFNNTTKSDILRLNKDYQTSVGPTGVLGKVQAAKKSLEQGKAEVLANATKIGYGPNEIQKKLQEAEELYIKKFNETGKIENFQAPMPAAYQDLQKDIFEVGKMMNSETITKMNEKGYRFEPTETGGMILVTKDGQLVETTNVPNIEVARKFLEEKWINDKGLGAQSATWQGLDKQTISNTINAGLGLQKETKSLDTTGEKYQYVAPSKGDLDYPEEGKPNGEYAEATSVEIYSTNILNKLNNIGKVLTAGGEPKFVRTGPGLNASGQVFAGSTSKEEYIATVQNQLNPKELEDYNRIYDNIIVNTPEAKGFNKYSPEAASLVQEYFNKNKQLIRQDFIITDDFAKSYGDRSVGVDGSSPKKIAELVQSNPKERKYFIEGSNKVISYDDLPSDIKKNFDNLKYSGYYSPKNFLTDKYGNIENKNLFVSPIRMQYRNDNGDIKNILVSRSGTEINSPEFQADKDFNDVFINTNKFPDIPYKIPKSKDKVVVYLSTPIMINGEKHSYIINTESPEGGYINPIPVTEKDLQSRFLRAHGATSTNIKKKK